MFENWIIENWLIIDHWKLKIPHRTQWGAVVFFFSSGYWDVSLPRVCPPRLRRSKSQIPSSKSQINSKSQTLNSKDLTMSIFWLLEFWSLVLVWKLEIENWDFKQNARYERFALVGFPIRKSPDQRLLSTSPRLIAATSRPSSPPAPKASTICP